MAELYRLTGDYINAYNALMESVDDETGEVDISLVEKFNEIEGEFDEKVEQTNYVRMSLISEAEEIDDTIKRLERRRDGIKRHAKSLEDYIINAMTTANRDKIKGKYAVVVLRSAKKTVIDDVALLEDRFIRFKKEPDKTAIKEAIKNGEVVEGARVEESNYLQIK